MPVRLAGLAAGFEPQHRTPGASADERVRTIPDRHGTLPG